MNKNFGFDGEMSREVLNNYLSRAVTHCGLGFDSDGHTESFEDDIRMLKNEGAKFIGRSVYVWANISISDPEAFAFTKEKLAYAHKIDPEFIFQACVFECIYKHFVNSVEIPAFVFEEFGLEPENRYFDYDAMKIADEPENRWGGMDTGIPDISKLEGQMWIFYRAASYISAGCEAIHLGQICLIGRYDKDFLCTKEVINRIRKYASKYARRHYVLIDAHTLGWLRQDETMFDYNAFPIRLKEIVHRPMECICEEGYLDSMFNERDGLCRPFIVEFDNFGCSENPGKPDNASHFAWGYDEITWFSKQPHEYRQKFLRYIADWVNARYPEGWVQMPSRRCLAGGARRSYSANTASENCPHGWSDEETIKSIFAEQ